MSTPWIILIVAVIIGALILIKRRQWKIDKGSWDEMPEIRQIILTAKTKDDLLSVKEKLVEIRKGSFENQFLSGSCYALITLIDDKIKIDYPLT